MPNQVNPPIVVDHPPTVLSDRYGFATFIDVCREFFRWFLLIAAVGTLFLCDAKPLFEGTQIVLLSVALLIWRSLIDIQRSLRALNRSRRS